MRVFLGRKIPLRVGINGVLWSKEMGGSYTSRGETAMRRGRSIAISKSIALASY